MKTFRSLQEERGEKAFKQAIAMGLQYSGFGYWKDPQTGETKYKTENDTLVPVEQEPEADLYKGGKPGEGGAQDGMGGQPGMGGMQGMTGPAGMLQMPGMGGAMPGAGILGAPEPGMEKAPKEKTWDPGPEGDTCVGPEAEEPGKVPEDSFVGRTNFLKWRSGPDGDNITTITPEMAAEGRSFEIFTEARGPKAETAHQNIQNLVADKNFPMETTGNPIGQGAYGTVHNAKHLHNDKPVVIKNGRFSSGEAQALHDLKDFDGFPSIINANVEKRDPGKKTDLQGQVAMEKVANADIADSWVDDVKDKRQAVIDMWKMKSQMHRTGYAHGDMHDGNVMWNKEKQKPALVDFGMAKKHWQSALMEALGGVDGHDGQQGLMSPWNSEDDLRMEFEEGLQSFADLSGEQMDLDEMQAEVQNQIDDHELYSANDVRDHFRGRKNRVIKRAINMLQGGQNTRGEADTAGLRDHLQGLNHRFSDGIEKMKKMREDFDLFNDDEAMEELVNLFYEGIDTYDTDNPPQVDKSGFKPVNVDDKLKKSINDARRAMGRSSMGSATINNVLNPDHDD